MIDLKEFKNLLEKSGLPVAYREFPKNDAPELPFICYNETGTNNFPADGIVYHVTNQIDVELYTKIKDLEVEDKVEKALSSFFWNKTETYLDDEMCFQIVYELEV